MSRIFYKRPIQVHHQSWSSVADDPFTELQALYTSGSWMNSASLSIYSPVVYDNLIRYGIGAPPPDDYFAMWELWDDPDLSLPSSDGALIPGTDEVQYFSVRDCQEYSRNWNTHLCFVGRYEMYQSFGGQRNKSPEFLIMLVAALTFLGSGVLGASSEHPGGRKRNT